MSPCVRGFRMPWRQYRDKCRYPLCASLDHVVPLSLGGGHTRDNVQCAHWLCNSLRGADDIDFMVA